MTPNIYLALDEEGSIILQVTVPDPSETKIIEAVTATEGDVQLLSIHLSTDVL